MSRKRKIPTNRQTKHREVFDALYVAHYQSMCVEAYFILHDEGAAEDVVQDLFLKLWQSNFLTDDIRRPEAYLRRSLRNACWDYLKKIKRQPSTDPFEEVVVSAEIDLLDAIVREEAMKDLDYAISELPEQCKKVLDLVYVEGKKYQEAADEMGISVNTVKTQLKRGMQKLRAKLKRYR